MQFRPNCVDSFIAARTLGVLSFVFVCCLSMTCSASIMKGDYVRFTRSGNSGQFGGAQGGGEYRVWKWDNINNSWFEVGRTFCLEINEGLGDSYYKVGAASSQIAALGGNDYDNDGYAGDEIKYATDLLYQKFSEGINGNGLGQIDLDGNGTYFQYDNGLWNNALQRAIWVLEDERNGFGNSSYSDEAELLHDWAIAASANMTQHSGNVFAINVFSRYTPNNLIQSFNPYATDANDWDSLRSWHFKQDQLFYFNNNNQSQVPEPSTIAVWTVIGLTGICYARKRRRTNELLTTES